MNNSILLEELNSENLRNRVDFITKVLYGEILSIKNGKIRNSSTEKGTNDLKSLTNDFQDLVQASRNKARESNLDKNILELCNKVENEWRRRVCPLIKGYNKMAKEYNKTHIPKLELIEIRTGTKITEEVNYFPY